MTNSRIPRPAPARSESLASEWDGLVSSARSTRLIAIAAIVVALVGVGLAAWAGLKPASPGTGTAGAGTSGGADCQAQAWAVAPAASDLPTGWAEIGSQYDPMRKSMGFAGPLADDGSQGQLVANITCYQGGAANSVALSQKAAADASQDPTARDDLGDQGFATGGQDNEFVQFRHGSLVASVYVQSPPASISELDQLASAFDKAMGGDGGNIRTSTPGPSDDLGNASQDPGDSGAPASPAAPELEAKLPKAVGDVPLTIESQTGSTIIPDDGTERGMVAALKVLGKVADDVREASAYDDAGNLNIQIMTIKGLAIEQTKAFVVGQWLSATGITQAPVTLGGKPFIKLDYNDQGPIDYVTTLGANVIVISTSDPAVAEQAAAALP